MKQYKNRFVEAIKQVVLNKYFYLFLVVTVVAMMSLVYFKDKPMISSNDNPEIRFN